MKFIALILSLTFIQTYALAEEEDGNLINFDQILTRLNRTETKQNFIDDSDPFKNVLIHAGVSLISSNISILPENGKEFTSFIRGIEASLGIDLFSKNWSAEGAVRSFAKQENNKALYSLKEFDLRIVYRNHLAGRTKWRAGLGMAARYLNYSAKEQGVALAEASISEEIKYTTPASILFVGVEGYLNSSLSIGADISYRSSLIDETADKNTLEASIRLDTHF